MSCARREPEFTATLHLSQSLWHACLMTVTSLDVSTTHKCAEQVTARDGVVLATGCPITKNLLDSAFTAMAVHGKQFPRRRYMSNSTQWPTTAVVAKARNKSLFTLTTA